MKEKITLEWMNKIRERIKEIKNHKDYGIGLCSVIDFFIKPILDYGESEENRINNEFEEKRK
jgi:hypothetical protein